MKIIISRAATADFARLRTFLGKTNPAAASRAVTDIRSAIRSLDTMPERGKVSMRPNTRELIVPFGRSAYIVSYTFSIKNDEIVVLRIWHGRASRD